MPERLRCAKPLLTAVNVTSTGTNANVRNLEQELHIEFIVNHRMRPTAEGSVNRGRAWLSALPKWVRPAEAPQTPPRIGLALGGGFARGIAHIGVLRVLERNQIPIHCITGVSAGAIVAAAFASGTSADEIAIVGRSMRFADVARWRICRLGLAGSERMSK